VACGRFFLAPPQGADNLSKTTLKTMKKALLISLSVTVLLLTAIRLWLPAYTERTMNPVTEHLPWPVSDEAQALHDSLFIGDWHADSLLWDRNLLKRSDYGQVDFPRLRAGNVALQVFTAVTKSPSGLNYHENDASARDNITLIAIGQTWPPATWGSLFERARYQARKLASYAQQAPDQVTMIYSRNDLDELIRQRQKGSRITGALMGMEGAHPLEGNIDNLDRLYNAGYRLLGITHFFDNELGGSLHGESDHGLTEFGIQVVKRADQKHMVIDLAHASPAVVNDVLRLTDSPVILSHTGIHSVCPVKRNIRDNLMQKISQHGGVIGIGYWHDVTCNETPEGIVRSIRAAIDLVGEDHVSLGSDFDGTIRTLFDASELAALTDQMLKQKFSETEIRKVMGDNMLRVLHQTLPQE